MAYILNTATCVFVLIFAHTCVSAVDTKLSESCSRDSDGNCGGETFRFVLLGKTGSGKSTSGNIILGEEKFETSLKMQSETAECRRESSQRNGATIEVMDSVGLFDTNTPHGDVATKLIQAVASMNPGPHAVFYVVPIGQRYTEEDYNAYKRLKLYFGDDLTEHMIVLLTHGDTLAKEGVTVEEYLQDTTAEFQQVLKECGQRYVVFDKNVSDMKPQVESLFKTVRAMLKQSGGRYFQSELTQKVEDKMKEFVAEILVEAERQELGGKQTVKELTSESKAAQDEAVKHQQQKEQTERENEELRRKIEAENKAREEAERKARQAPPPPKKKVPVLKKVGREIGRVFKKLF